MRYVSSRVTGRDGESDRDLSNRVVGSLYSQWTGVRIGSVTSLTRRNRVRVSQHTIPAEFTPLAHVE